MSYGEIVRKLTELVGSDTTVTFDDPAEPSELRFYRPDPLGMDLVRDALEKASATFPDEMAVITTVSVAFDDTFGARRRRVIG